VWSKCTYSTGEVEAHTASLIFAPGTHGIRTPDGVFCVGTTLSKHSLHSFGFPFKSYSVSYVETFCRQVTNLSPSSSGLISLHCFSQSVRSTATKCSCSFVFRYNVCTIYTSLQTDNHTNTSSVSFYRPDVLPDAQPTVSKH